MKIFELRKKSLTALLLASMALVMLPGCSSTEEAPPPTGDVPPPGGDDLNCDEGDTREECVDAIL